MKEKNKKDLTHIRAAGMASEEVMFTLGSEG